MKEANFGRYPKGLAVGLDSFECWLHDDKLAQEKLFAQEVYDYLRRGVDENLINPDDQSHGLFEELIKKWLLDNNHKAFVTAVPKVGLNMDKDAKLTAMLIDYKKTLTEAEIEALIRDTEHLKAYQTEPSTPEELATIPLLNISDINPNVRKTINRETEVAGIKTIAHDIFTNGITYVDMFFRANDFEYDDLPKAALLFELLKYVDTDEHTYNELSTEINLKTGGILFNLGCLNRNGEGSLTYAQCKLKTFDANVSDGIKLVQEIITSSHITDKKRIKEVLSEIKAAGKNSLVEGGHVTARLRAGSYIDSVQKIMDGIDGVDYSRFIDDIDKRFDEVYDELAADLTRIYKKIFRVDSLIISYTSNQSESAMEDSLKELSASLSQDKYEDRDAIETELEVKNEGFNTSSKVQYVATAGDFSKAGLEFNGALNVLQIIFAYDYLWVNVRVKGGAYGAMCDFTRNGYSFFTSYRDPNLAETYDIYKNAYKYDYLQYEY